MVGTTSSWGDIEFLIFFVTILLTYFNPWGRNDYSTNYETYKAKYRAGWLLKYPPLWFYKIMWAFVYACIVGGTTIAWIYLEEKTEWYIIVLSLFISNIMAMHFWHVAFWRWDNWNSLGTADTIFLMLTSGAIAGIVGFRADREGTMVLWGAFSAYAIYWAWTTYCSLIALTTEWANYDSPRHGRITERTKHQRGTMPPATPSARTRHAAQKGSWE